MEKAEIYTIFGGPFQKDADKLLDELQSRCSDVNFVGKTFVSERPVADVGKISNSVLDEIRNQKNELDGILVFGIYYDHGLTSIGLPVVMVRGLLYWDESWDRGLLHFYRGEKLLDAQLCEIDSSPEVSAARFDDLVEKIELLATFKKIKESRLLNITYDANDPGSGECFYDGGTKRKSKEYKEAYFPKLKKLLGLELATIDYHELNRAIGNTEEKEAEKIAEMWTTEAKEVRNVNRSKMIQSAKMYLAIAELMKKYNCNAMTMASWHFFAGRGDLKGKSVTDAMPPLAEMELSKQLKVTSCETLIDCIVTQMAGLYSTGRPSFVGDILGLDIYNQLAIFGHCYAPVNPYGDERRVPYTIREHAVSNETGKYPSAVAIEVELPVNEIITAVKFSVYDEKISLFTGNTVPAGNYYTGFDDVMCKTKLVAKIDMEPVRQNLDNDTFGHHYAIFYGDWRKKFRQLGTLLGFEVLEEDSSLQFRNH
jgi:hypothetical protein